MQSDSPSWTKGNTEVAWFKQDDKVLVNLLPGGQASF